MRLAKTSSNQTTSLLTGTTNIDYLYDASGNMTRESTNRNLEYDYRQRTRLYFITNNTTLYEQYTYGADGNVVKRLNRSSGLIYSYVYIDGLFQYSDQIGHASNAQNHINILDPSGAIISQHRQGTFAGEVAYTNGELYMINNHVGSVIGTYDLNGTQQEGEDYYPFGDSSHHWNGNKQQRFAGKIRLSWTGYYDFGARQYIPWLAKFTSVDPLAAKSTDRNPYHYASNNPINRVDPSGMKDEPSGNGGGDDKKANNNLSSKTGGTSVSTKTAGEKISTSGNDTSLKLDFKPPQTTEVGGLDRTNAPNIAAPMLQQSGSPEPDISHNAPSHFLSAPDASDNRTIKQKDQDMRRHEASLNLAKLRSDVSASSPFVGGGKGMGEGFAKTVAVAAAEAPAVILPEMAFSKFVSAVKAIRAAKMSTQSLGAGRTAVKEWLQGASNLERSALIQNIESAGFKRMSPTSSPVSVFERGGMKIRLDPPQSGTPFNHMHLEYGGNSYNVFLKPVNYKSPAAHIPIK